MADDETRDPHAEPRELNRRQFVQTVGAAGLAGAVGGLAPGLVNPLSAQPAAQAGAAEFPAPPGLRKGAQLDSRFPVSFATPVSQGLRLITEYFTALSERNLEAIARTLHFPFAIYEDIEPVVVQSAADFMSNPPPSLNGTGKGKTRINPGSYDLLESINVHLYCPIGGAFSLSFTRYTPDGHKLLACDGMYGVTNNDGRWAIQMASTIVHEVDSAATRTTWPRLVTATRRRSTIRSRAADPTRRPCQWGREPRASTSATARANGRAMHAKAARRSDGAPKGCGAGLACRR
jgi:hypothetical protein